MDLILCWFDRSDRVARNGRRALVLGRAIDRPDAALDRAPGDGDGGDDRDRPVRHRDRNDGEADAAGDPGSGACRPGPLQAAGDAAPGRGGDLGRGDRLPPALAAVPGRGRSDLGRLHQARRQRDLARDHRPRLRARPRARSPGAVDQPAGARRLSGGRLPDRRLRADGGDVEDLGPGRRLHHPALDGGRRSDAGPASARDGASDRAQCRRLGPDRDRGLALRALPRLLPLGRGQGAGDRGAAAARPAARRAGRPGRLAAPRLGDSQHHRRRDHRRPRARWRAVGESRS